METKAIKDLTPAEARQMLAAYAMGAEFYAGEAGGDPYGPTWKELCQLRKLAALDGSHKEHEGKG